MTTTIQNAINSVSAMAPNANGFRGAVLLTAGNYPISGSLSITASGVVLEGQGNDPNVGTRLEATGTDTRQLFSIKGSGGASTVSNTTHNITDSYVPVGATTFHVDSTANLAVGDTVVVYRPATNNWLQAIGMATVWNTNEGAQHSYRIITAINGNQITINAPITNSLDQQYGGGQIYKYTWSKQISQVGLENIYTYSDSTGTTDPNHASGLLSMDDTINSWVNNVTANGYASNGILLGGGVLYATLNNVTVENTSKLSVAPPSGILTSAQLTLIENSTFINAFHSIAIGAAVPGPDVYYNITSTAASGYGAGVGPHFGWSTGGLFDNVTVTGTQLLVIKNGDSLGWDGGNYVFWNDQNNTEIDVYSPPTAQNWAIGGSATTTESFDKSLANERGIFNQFGTTVTPLILYQAQLLDRLTPTVATAAAAAPSTVTGKTTSLSVLGADVAGESTLTYTWSVLSAPTGAPAVTFSANGTNTSKNTVATFAQAGTYILQATIQYPGGFSATSTVTVGVNQTLTGIAVSPGPVSINENTPQQFTALATDQFGNPMTATVNWTANGGQINSAGLYTSPATPNNYTVIATNGSVNGSATVTVLNAAAVLSAAATASPAPVTGTTTNLSALALGDTGQASLTYTWSATSIPRRGTAPPYSPSTAPMPPRTRRPLSAAPEPIPSRSRLPIPAIRLSPAV